MDLNVNKYIASCFVWSRHTHEHKGHARDARDTQGHADPSLKSRTVGGDEVRRTAWWRLQLVVPISKDETGHAVRTYTSNRYDTITHAITHIS